MPLAAPVLTQAGEKVGGFGAVAASDFEMNYWLSHIHVLSELAGIITPCID
jgi:hypothetical protein